MRTPPPTYEQSVNSKYLVESTYTYVSEKMALLQPDKDIEAAQARRSPSAEDPTSGKHAAEYQVAARVKYSYLAVYFGLNLGLTLFNKAVLGRVCKHCCRKRTLWAETLWTVRFPVAPHNHPYWHGRSGLFDFAMAGTLPPDQAELAGEPHITGVFDSLHCQHRHFECLIVSGSWKSVEERTTDCEHREMVSVSFHQIMRSTTPIFTILIYRLWYSRSYAMATYLSLIPIVFGVALTTIGDYYFTPLGFVLTTLGVILAALKTVATNRLMTGKVKLHALELLFRMSPLAAIQSFLFALALGEFNGFYQWVQGGYLNSKYMNTLAGNGLIAFLLNIASLHTNKLAGALTMTICANLKQCLTVILGIVMFHTKVTTWSGYGMVITLVGAAVYSKVELEMKGKQVAPRITSPPGDKSQERTKKDDFL